jgi:hypothetical protein
LNFFNDKSGEGDNNNLFKDIEDRVSPPPLTPPIVPPAPAPPTLSQKCREWLGMNHISGVNSIMRAYPPELIFEAIEDFERAVHPAWTSQRFVPRDRTAYFRSLLR